MDLTDRPGGRAAEDPVCAEPAAPRRTPAYAREHPEIFRPMRHSFGLVREIATALTHVVGAFGSATTNHRNQDPDHVSCRYSRVSSGLA